MTLLSIPMRSRPSIAGAALGRSAGAAPAAERRGSGGWSARPAPRLGGVEGPLAARPGECWAARLARSGSAGGRAAARLLGDGGAARRGVWAARPAGQPCDAEGRLGDARLGRPAWALPRVSLGSRLGFGYAARQGHSARALQVGRRPWSQRMACPEPRSWCLGTNFPPL